MIEVSVTAQRFQVDAVTVAAAFGLDPAHLQDKMRPGEVTSLCEKGVDADEGRFRLTFRHAGRVLRLTVDEGGQILTRSTFDAPRSPLRKSGARP
ncbi:hypothetical protein SAMN05421774_12122 [Gemmobacter megaterium]|uniref:Uncharacterized protein n=1 Tax=Gemmobacter megaterium TaxID=1086013 RepID=A0A1N7QR04_9RHOB|nr:DUF6522 family protein [Gemmobacter megaterium]GGE28927.1 hypothetical protein GCM10011345_38740 [Gemmobacter megaterium]SIT25322.1 hypothetical protein SAMN05421774_12122 [Gemmobacter megaterium]